MVDHSRRSLEEAVMQRWLGQEEMNAIDFISSRGSKDKKAMHDNAIAEGFAVALCSESRILKVSKEVDNSLGKCNGRRTESELLQSAAQVVHSKKKRFSVSGYNADLQTIRSTPSTTRRESVGALTFLNRHLPRSTLFATDTDYAQSGKLIDANKCPCMKLQLGEIASMLERDPIASSRQDDGMHVFHVKKADHVFEKLGSKKSMMRIQINPKAKLIICSRPGEARQSYACASLTTKHFSKAGLLLRIHSGNAIVSRKITFRNTEERTTFQATLDKVKLAMKRNNYNFVNQLDTVLKSHEASSIETWQLQISDSDERSLYPGEVVVEHVQRVTHLIVMSQNDRAVQGLLKITTYRISFTPYDTSWKFGSFEVPLAAIDIITRDGLMLSVSCKDLRTVRLAMHDAFIANRGCFDRSPHTPDIRWLNLLTLRMRPPTQISSLFAFDYHDHLRRQKDHSSTVRKDIDDGWSIYSPTVEYQRLGLLPKANVCKGEETVCDRVRWRILANNNYRFSPTYPNALLVPSIMSEEDLVQSARFRSRARLPVAVWRHPLNRSVLARSSQPNYGMTGNRSHADRTLLKAIRESAKPNQDGISPQLHIVDARKPIATKGNRLRGKGVENPQHYDNASIEFLGIANIHKMRESLDALKLLVTPNTAEDTDKHYHNRLENTRWLKHIMRLLSGARRIAEILHEDGASVLVHCSDGWDRTPQLVSLSQMILDPFYRTIRGLTVLIEKEWCSFGHKFTDRIGAGRDISELPNERSPVMLQFLDCVWQMTRQFPNCFEFNDRFLLHIVDALHSGLYGTFLFNTERERVADEIRERTESVWTDVFANFDLYKNGLYKPTNRILYPRANLKRVVLWDTLFFRWDPESHPEYVEMMELMTLEGTNTNDDLGDSPDGRNFREIEEEYICKSPLALDGIDNSDICSSHIASSKVSDSYDEEGHVNCELMTHTLKCDAYPTASSIATDSESICSRMVNLYSDMIEPICEQARERTEQRSRCIDTSGALQTASTENRVQFLEKLLSESFAREMHLEAVLGSIHDGIEAATKGILHHPQSESSVEREVEDRRFDSEAEYHV